MLSASAITGSSIVTVVDSTLVVVPCTVRLPVITALPATLMLVEVISFEESVPFTVTSLKVTLEVVATFCPIDKATLLLLTREVTPVPPVNVRVSPLLKTSVLAPSEIVKEEEIAAVLKAVTRPFVSTVITGILVELP